MNDFRLRAARIDDASWIAELRAVVLRPDLERLGRFDPTRVRRRFLDGFRPDRTRVISVAGDEVGVIAVRPEAHEVWIEHFYLPRDQQGRGLGGAVLRWALEQPTGGLPFRLNVLQGSAARRLYERHGFVFEHEDPVDVWMVRHPSSGENCWMGPGLCCPNASRRKDACPWASRASAVLPTGRDPGQTWTANSTRETMAPPT